MKYDILVKEISSFVNPDEVEISNTVNHSAQRLFSKTQEKRDNGSGTRGWRLKMLRWMYVQRGQPMRKEG